MTLRGREERACGGQRIEIPTRAMGFILTREKAERMKRCEGLYRKTQLPLGVKLVGCKRHRGRDGVFQTPVCPLHFIYLQ